MYCDIWLSLSLKDIDCASMIESLGMYTPDDRSQDKNTFISFVLSRYEVSGSNDWERKKSCNSEKRNY